jgi:hypothetical protein
MSEATPRETVDLLLRAALEELSSARGPGEVEAVRVRYLGRRGLLT